MYKLKPLLLPVAWLLAFMALACAPPDDDAPSSGPTINNAIYDVGMALLTVQGNHLSPTEAQIQTIRVAGLALSSYTADDPATGPDSHSLAKGKYRIANDGTALWLRLTDADKATLNGKPGMDSNGLKKGLLSVGTGAWAGLDTAKDLTVSNITDKPSKQPKAEDQSPKQPKDEQVEQDEQQSPKQPKDEQVEQDEQQSPKQPKDEQVEQDEQQSPKQPKDEQVEQDEQQSPKQAEQAEEDEQVEQDEQQSPKQAEQAEEDEQVEQDEQQSPKQAEQAEEDEQVEQAEEESPKAAITGASYNVGTALLTVQGTHLASATQAQIQTITVDGIALDSYTADGTATGPDSRSLAKGKYRIKSDGTVLWFYLTDQHKATLNGKTGMDSNGRKDGLLTSTGAWAGLDTAKGLAVSGNPAPTITRATYSSVTSQLVITGVNLPTSVWGWDFTKLTLVSGDGSKRFTLPKHSEGKQNRAEGSGASATGLTITLIGSVKAKADKIFVNDGVRDDAGAYNLEAAAGFAGGSAEDTTNPITVRGYTTSITEATYDANTGELYIIGDNLPRAVADWDFSKLTLVSGDGSKRYPLPEHAIGENTATGSRAGTTYLTITLSGSVKAEAEKILVNDGDSDNNGAYNLEAAAGFAGGSAEDTSNPITVSGHTASITSAIYYARRGFLLITGVRLPTAVADWDFSKLTLVSGDGKKKYTLPEHAIGENTATGSNASATSLDITLSGSVKAEVNKILVKRGKSDNNGAYNLKAAAEFVTGSPEDPTTGINVLR